jgi:hypothetical protein
MSFILVLFLYAGTFSKGDSVALTSIPGFATEQACAAAGQKAEALVKNTLKDSRFICVQSK